MKAWLPLAALIVVELVVAVVLTNVVLQGDDASEAQLGPRTFPGVAQISWSTDPPRSERLASPPPTEPPITIPVGTSPCSAASLGTHVSERYDRVLLNFWARYIYLVNESTNSCFINGEPVLTGITTDGSEIPLVNHSWCPESNDRCTRPDADVPILLQPQSETNAHPQAAYIQIGLQGQIPDFCEDPIPEFPAVRVSWPQGSLDVKSEVGFAPCQAELWGNPFQLGDLPTFDQPTATPPPAPAH